MKYSSNIICPTRPELGAGGIGQDQLVDLCFIKSSLKISCLLMKANMFRML